MPKITVEIEIDTDSGAVMVGVEPPDESAGAPMDQGAAPAVEDKSYLQPANSVDEALSTAKDLLTNPQAQAAEAPTPEQVGKSRDQMWNKVRADRQTANQPGGPMMGGNG